MEYDEKWGGILEILHILVILLMTGKIKQQSELTFKYHQRIFPEHLLDVESKVEFCVLVSLREKRTIK